VIDDRGRQQRDIDLCKRIKDWRGYEDHEQDKEPMYPLDDDVEMASENAEEAASRGEGSEEYEG